MVPTSRRSFPGARRRSGPAGQRARRSARRGRPGRRRRRRRQLGPAVRHRRDRESVGQLAPRPAPSAVCSIMSTTVRSVRVASSGSAMRSCPAVLSPRITCPSMPDGAGPPRHGARGGRPPPPPGGPDCWCDRRDHRTAARRHLRRPRRRRHRPRRRLGGGRPDHRRRRGQGQGRHRAGLVAGGRPARPAGRPPRSRWRVAGRQCASSPEPAAGAPSSASRSRAATAAASALSA